jgi:hypothetical protein
MIVNRQRRFMLLSLLAGRAGLVGVAVLPFLVLVLLALQINRRHAPADNSDALSSRAVAALGDPTLLKPTAVPEGFELVNEYHETFTLGDGSTIYAHVFKFVHLDRAAGLTVSVYPNAGGRRFDFASLDATGTRALLVRGGKAAILSTTVPEAPDEGLRILGWLETPNLYISVIGRGPVSETELVQIANGLGQ